MPNVPSTPPDPWSGHPIIDLVARQLRAFGDLTREQAAQVLPYWAHFARLTPREVAAVLARFPETISSPIGDEINTDHGWISGTMGTDEPQHRVIDTDGETVPHGADRWANPGETCTCGRPAVVVYEQTGGHPLGYCGRSES